MSEWGVALIAAGAAIAGSVVTGWFGRSAGVRQAEAARCAGDRQADALLESVRMTLRGEDRRRALALRRQIYAEFLAAVEARVVAERTNRRTGDEELALRRAHSAVVLEGPTEVADAAGRVVDGLRRHQSADDVHRVKLEFIAVAQQEVNPPAR
ncbi:hypothetical protein NGF19_05385 [Streptomyces sp. RY43-2]|uniref:Uncharacterized protein n=1 Tax=Streptomyces macrolidinus TaxID=2952607 RepID=A0ABT0Z8Z1_9ACTN|nr:hypothetical protein [Streptomyces macrolidinus]MCN9240230.1 hypothetical protein [Streptomyces macrolidinus]